MKWRYLGVACVVACSAQGEKALKEATPQPPPPSRAGTLTDPLSEEYQPPPLPRARAILTDAFGSKHAVEVEIAADERARNRGLMWRKELKEGAGMLFIFQEVSAHSFYMRNTLIPLDMIFIGPNWEIVGIVARTEPRSWTPRGVDRPSQYVLEVPGGWAEKIGLRPGSTVELEKPL